MIRILVGLASLPIVLAGSAATGSGAAESAAIVAPVKIAQADCSGYGSNIEIKACLRRNYEAADADLNRVYGRVKAGLGKEQRELLTDAQLAWITYRDQGCEFEVFGSRGGTGHGGFLSECKERVTRSRIAELEAFLRDR